MTQRSLGRAAAGGAAYVGTAQAVSVLVSLLSTIIVARLLTPDDYGVMAMVAPVTAFLIMFRHLGLNHAAVQARSITDRQVNSLFWINMTASAAIGLVLLALAPVVTWFYEDVRAGYVTAASAVNIIVAGSATQHMAMMNREMRFGRISAIDIGSSFVTLAATVALAWALRTYWALWLGGLAATLFSSVLTWRSSRWRPSRPAFRGVGDMVRFGGAVTGFNLLNFLHRNLDNVLIGKMWGPVALGLYDRSYRLMMFPLQNINGPLGRVMLPVLSRLQDQPARYRRSYLLAARAIMLMSLPAIAVAAATSDRLVPFLLGDRWSGASPIFFWLSLAALLQPIGNSTGWLFISSGRPGALLRWATFHMSIMVPALAVAVQWGPAAVAAAYFLTGALVTPFLFAYCVRGTSVSTWDMYAICAPPFLAAALTWAGIHFLLADWPIVPLLAVALPTAYAVSLGILWVAPEGRDHLRTLLSLAASTASSSRWMRR